MRIMWQICESRIYGKKVKRMRLIDADALKNTFKDKEGNEFTAFHFYDAIDNAPTIERPHGEWIYHKEWELDGECAFECSKCGMGVDVDYNFCPNCGADMREGERNDDF